MTGLQSHSIATISDYHKLMRLSKPQHPLVSVIRFEDVKRLPYGKTIKLVMPFYSVALKRNFNARFKYGQQEYDFDEGIMTFMSPGQVLKIEVESDEELKHTGWLLLVHPDFLWNTSLAKSIKGYEYFSYAVHEALHLSEKEEVTVTSIMQNIEQEYCANIDKFSQEIIIAQIELLLNYSDRFYHRQFITRKKSAHEILARLENVLEEYFNSDIVNKKGLPTVEYIANTLAVSPNYLSGLLKTLTGATTQQHIQNKLIEKAKEKLSTTNLSVSEIAYELGFEHPQSFSKLFKAKAKISPLEFRHSFD